MLFINETYLSLRILSPYALTSGHRCQLSPLHQSVSHQYPPDPPRGLVTCSTLVTPELYKSVRPCLLVMSCGKFPPEPELDEKLGKEIYYILNIVTSMRRRKHLSPLKYSKRVTIRYILSPLRSCSLGCHATLPETTTFFYINAFSGSKRWNFLRLFSDYKWT